MKLKELLDVVPCITSVRISIYGRPYDRRYLFTNEIEHDLDDYEVMSVSPDYTNINYLFIRLEDDQ